jgi:hypothetical protein
MTSRGDAGRYVVGETYPGYSYHLREIGSTPVHLGGHVVKPMSLCGRPLAWDTQIPVKGFDDCKRCVAALQPPTPHPGTRGDER